MCPFRVDRCGAADSVVFGKSGLKSTEALNTQPGDVCVFNVRANCGNPAFSVTPNNKTGLETFIIEYDDWDVYT